MGRRKIDDKRDNAFFVRVNDKELDIIEAAIQLHYGAVQGNKSHFARYCMLLVSKQIIKKARKAREER